MSSRVKNALYTKQYNRLKILRLLRQEPLSRASLARLTGLTRAAISLITEDLIAEGMIRESSLPTQSHLRGRIPVLLELCENAAYAVGIRLTRTACHVGICNFQGQLITHERIPLASSAEALIQPIADTVNRLLFQAGIPRQKLLGVGVSAPGPVDALSGTILNPPDFPGFRNFPIGSRLSELLELPVYLENDANAAALHNYMDGKFADKENFLLLIVDSGVGSGVISRGRLLRSGGFTCELGHMSIDFRGPRCACGNRGCLEVFAATHRVLAQFPSHDSWEELMVSVDAPAALQTEAEYLAAAILNFSNILHIDAVLLAGDLQAQCGRLAPLIQQNMQGHSLTLGETALAILPALQDNDSCVREACSIVFGHFLEVS